MSEDNEMYEYLLEHNYISKNENKNPLRQQELSKERAECIANKYNSLVEEKTKVALASHKYASQCEDKVIVLQNNWNDLKKSLKEEINICNGCIDTMQSNLQEIAPRGSGKSYVTGEIFKNKVAKRSFEVTLKKMQKLEEK